MTSDDGENDKVTIYWRQRKDGSMEKIEVKGPPRFDDMIDLAWASYLENREGVTVKEVLEGEEDV